MRRLKTPWLLLPGTLALLACVTINVYFPAAAAEQAADKIIDQVQGEAATETTEPQAATVRREIGYWAAAGLSTFLELVVPPAQAQANIDISTPAIRALVSSMESRYPALKAYYRSGAIGLTREATIEIRDRNAIPLAERSRVNKLVSDENSDRNTLYAEIAKANGHPEWEDQIRRTFAERWIAKAGSGWYYRNASGDWAQKR